MASKAAAALSRVREIDKKYKSKQENRFSLSSDSFKSINTEKPQKLLKPQLNIKMPDPYEEYISGNTSSDSEKHSVPIKIVSELPKKLSSDDTSDKNNSPKRHETPSDKITTDSEIVSKKDETNESISEILEDSQSLSQTSVESTASKKSTNEVYYKNSSLNLSLRNETLKSDKKIKTEKEENKEKEKHVTEYSDLETQNLLVHYSDESFESSSSEATDSQSTTILEQLYSKINDEKVSSKELKILSTNQTDPLDDMVSERLNVSRKEERESKEKSNISTKNSSSSNTDSTSIKQPSHELKSINGQINHEDNDDEIVRTVEKTSSESKITSRSSKKQQIKSSESISQVLIILDRKSNKKKAKESDDTIEAIESSSSSTLLTSSTSTRSPEITKHKEPEKVATHRKRKYVQYKPNERYCSSAMINYIRKLKEEQYKLHILPLQPICPDKIKFQSIKPLEFPKIFNFIQNNEYKNSDLNLEILQNQISYIRQWLKEQYLIYRENSEVAVHVNRNYHPTTLNETKKIIYQLQSKVRAKNKNQ